MFEWLPMIIGIALLSSREKGATYGSPQLLAGVVGGVWGGTYLAGVFLIGPHFDSILALVALLHVVGAGVGYGAYRLVVYLREEYYADKFDV